MDVNDTPYYRRDLALVHHRGFGFHADDCPPGILELPDDPLPAADAIVSVGHVLNYLPDESAIDRALVAITEALRPGGVLAIDLCDLEYGKTRRDLSNMARRQRLGDHQRALGSVGEPARPADDHVRFERRWLVAPR